MGWETPSIGGLRHQPVHVAAGYIPQLPESGWTWFDLDWPQGPALPGTGYGWMGMQYGLVTCAVLLAWEGGQGDVSVEIPDWEKHSETWTVSKNGGGWQYGALFSYRIGPVNRSGTNPRTPRRALLLGRGVIQNEADWVGGFVVYWWPTADTLYDAKLLGQTNPFEGWDHPKYYPDSAKIYDGTGEFIGDGEDPDLILNDRHPVLAWNGPGKPKPGFWGPKEPQWQHGWLVTNGYPARYWEEAIRTLHVVANGNNAYAALRVGPDWIGDFTSYEIGFRNQILDDYSDHNWFELSCSPGNYDTELLETISPVSEIAIAVTNFETNVNGVYRPKISDVRTSGVLLPNYQYRDQFVPTPIYADGADYGPRDVLYMFLGASFYVEEVFPT